MGSRSMIGECLARGQREIGRFHACVRRPTQAPSHMNSSVATVDAAAISTAIAPAAQGVDVTVDFQAVVLQPQPALAGARLGLDQGDVVVLVRERHHDPVLAAGGLVHAKHLGIPARGGLWVTHEQGQMGAGDLQFHRVLLRLPWRSTGVPP